MELTYNEFMSEKITAFNQLNNAETTNMILRTAKVGIWSIILKPDKRPEYYLDDMVEEFAGLHAESPEELFEQHAARIDLRYKKRMDLLLENVKSGKPDEAIYEYRHPQRGLITIRSGARLNPDYKGLGVQIYGYHQDITENSQELMDSRAVVETFGNMFFAVYKVNLEDNTLIRLKSGGLMESGAAEIKKATEVTKAIVYTISNPEMRQKFAEFADLSTLPERLRSGKSISCEHFSNVYGWCRSSIAPLKYKSGKLTEVLFIVQEIDDEKKKELEYQKSLVEAKLEAQSASEAKTQFLNNMSHDIRTPMNAIIGLTNIAKKSLDNKEDLKDCLEKIEVSSKHLLALINGVLDMSKLESGNMSFIEGPFNLVELLDEVLTITNGIAKDNEIEVVLDDECKFEYRHLIGCSLHFRQVLINIASNAIKYNKPGGYIKHTIREKVIDSSTVEITATIKDSGIGMSPEFLKKVFEPFAQESDDARTQYAGSGLGLSIVKLMVDNLGGRIEINSEQGVGTEVSVTIPFKINKDAVYDEQDEEEGEVSLEGVQILLVEDNHINQMVAQRMLNDIGAVVTVANNGEQALDIFFGSEQGTFDLILMDIMMPVLDGISATKAIRISDREDAKKIPIIAMTANAFAEDAQKCIEAGMDKHIAKPFEADKVVKVLQEWVKKEHHEN